MDVGCALMSRTTRPDGLRTRIDELLEEYRATLHDSLEGLTEQEARASLVPSKTTLLGLLKHVTFVEAVWFGEAVSAPPRARRGQQPGPVLRTAQGRHDRLGAGAAGAAQHAGHADILREQVLAARQA